MVSIDSQDKTENEIKQDQAIRRFFGYHYLRLRLSLVTGLTRQQTHSRLFPHQHRHLPLRLPSATTALRERRENRIALRYPHIGPFSIFTHIVHPCCLPPRAQTESSLPAAKRTLVSFLPCPAWPGLAFAFVTSCYQQGWLDSILLPFCEPTATQYQPRRRASVLPALLTRATCVRASLLVCEC